MIVYGLFAPAVPVSLCVLFWIMEKKLAPCLKRMKTILQMLLEKEAEDDNKDSNVSVMLLEMWGSLISEVTMLASSTVSWENLLTTDFQIV